MRRTLSVRIAVAVVTALVTGTVPAAQDRPIPVTERIIDRNFTIRGIGHCTVGSLALTVGRTVAAPIGVEFVPGRCDDSRSSYRPLVEPVSLLGMTAGEALNRLVEIDPRYAWKEAGGVLVMRPHAAWADGRHFLHRKVASFEMVDENLGAALELTSQAIWQYEGPDLRNWGRRTPQGAHRFTVRLGQVQIVDALNAVVREHGNMEWRITYCQPYAQEPFAMLNFRTFDEDGLGTGPGLQRDASGKTYDPCGGRW